MRKGFRAIIAAFSITFAIVFSCRVVMIPTALNPAETVGLLCMLIEYTVLKSRNLEDETKKSS